MRTGTLKNLGLPPPNKPTNLFLGTGPGCAAPSLDYGAYLGTLDISGSAFSWDPPPKETKEIQRVKGGHREWLSQGPSIPNEAP